MAGDSRQRMVESAMALIGSRGLNGTSLMDVVDASAAPRGSIYHHFPEGKDQLAREAIALTTATILAHCESCPGGSPAEVLDWFLALWRAVARHSPRGAGCAVAGVAIDACGDGAMLSAAEAAFSEWERTLAEQLERAGLARARAAAIATTTIATMEGALILCRAAESAAPLLTAADQLLQLVT